MATTYTTHYNFGKPGNRDPGYGPIINGDLDAIDAALYSLSVNKLDSSSYNATDILNKLLTVDGTGSGLDADKLDGQEGSYYAAAAHVHGNISNAGYVGSAANIPLITGTDGIVQAGSFGSTANTFCQGNDARLSDARTPTSHAHGNISNAGYLGSSANIPLITGTDGIIQAGSFGTGANNFAAGNHTHVSLYQPLENQRLSTTDSPTFVKLKLDSTDFPAWAATYIPLEWKYCSIVSRTDSGSIYINDNLFYDGVWKYKATAPSARYTLSNGEHYLQTAASGTGGNAVTFINGIKVDITGKTFIYQDLNLDKLTASKVLTLDASKNVVSSYALNQDLATSSSPTFANNTKIQTDQNANTAFNVANATNGSAASSGIRTTYGADLAFTWMRTFSPSFTTDGLKAAGCSSLYSQGSTGGLNVFTLDGYPLRLGTNNTTAITISTAQNTTFAGSVTLKDSLNFLDTLDGNLLFKQKNSSPGTSAATFYQQNNNENKGIEIITYGSAHTANPGLGLIQMNTGALKVQSVGNYTLTLGTNNTARLTISGDGVINLPLLTASKVLTLDGSKNIVSTYDLNQHLATTSSPTFVNTTLSSNLLLYNASCAHGVTDVAPTNIGGKVYTTASGTYKQIGISSAAGSAGIQITGILYTSPTAAAIEMYAFKKNGATYNAVGATEKALSLTNYATELLHIKGNGNINLPLLTASKVLTLDSSKNIVSTYDLDQSLATTSSPTFKKITLTGNSTTGTPSTDFKVEAFVTTSYFSLGNGADNSLMLNYKKSNGDNVISVDGHSREIIFGDFSTFNGTKIYHTVPMTIKGTTVLGIVTAYEDVNGQGNIVVRNKNTGDQAGGGIVLAGSGNSWLIECGSAAKNSNTLNFYLDYTSPVSKASLDTFGNFNALGYKINGVAGTSGSFTSNDGKTITVTNGIVTGIV